MIPICKTLFGCSSLRTIMQTWGSPEISPFKQTVCGNAKGSAFSFNFCLSFESLEAKMFWFCMSFENGRSMYHCSFLTTLFVGYLRDLKQNHWLIVVVLTARITNTIPWGQVYFQIKQRRGVFWPHQFQPTVVCEWQTRKKAATLNLGSKPGPRCWIQEEKPNQQSFAILLLLLPLWGGGAKWQSFAKKLWVLFGLQSSHVSRLLGLFFL